MSERFESGLSALAGKKIKATPRYLRQLAGYLETKESKYKRNGPKCFQCGRRSLDRLDCGDFRCAYCDSDWWEAT